MIRVLNQQLAVSTKCSLNVVVIMGLMHKRLIFIEGGQCFGFYSIRLIIGHVSVIQILRFIFYNREN